MCAIIWKVKDTNIASNEQPDVAALARMLHCKHPIVFVTQMNGSSLLLIDDRDTVMVALTKTNKDKNVHWLGEAYRLFGQDEWSDDFVFTCTQHGPLFASRGKDVCQRHQRCDWNGCANPVVSGTEIAFRCGHVRDACQSCARWLKTCCLDCRKRCRCAICKSFSLRTSALASQ
jgi:hypothetical protein